MIRTRKLDLWNLLPCQYGTVRPSDLKLNDRLTRNLTVLITDNTKQGQQNAKCYWYRYSHTKHNKKQVKLQGIAQLQV